MAFVHVSRALVGGALVAALGACSSGDDGDAADDPGVTQDLLVTDVALAEDVTVFPDHLEVPRAGHEDLLAVRAGKILAGGPAKSRAGNPNGFLRRAVAVRGVDDRIVIDTQPATLTDVFRGHAQVDVANPTTDTAGDTTSGASLHTQGWLRTLGGRLNLTPQNMIANAVGWAVDPVHSNETYDVKIDLASGDFSYTPDVTSAIDMSGGELRAFSLSAAGRVDAEAHLAVSVEAHGSLATTRRGLLQPIHFDRRLVEFPAARAVQFVSGVPVWETVELSLVIRCDFSFNGEVGATVNVHAVADGKLGAAYDAATGWRSLRDGPSFDATGSGIDVDQIGLIDAKCSLEPQIALMVYDIAGPTLAIGPYANVHVDEVQRTWSLQPGVRADLGALIEFAGNQVISERVSIMDETIGEPFTGALSPPSSSPGLDAWRTYRRP